MSTHPVPEHVELRKVFARERKIEGLVPVSSFKHLVSYLIDDSGEVSISVEFKLDGAKRRMVTGQIHATVSMQCQRCLEAIKLEITDEINLALLESEDQIKNIPRQMDPWICETDRLSLLDIVQEQLILCLPIVAAHETGKCNADASYSIENQRIESGINVAERDSNPFALLKQLKNNLTN